METKKYKVFTEEFRKEALELLKSSGKSMKQLEQELGITAGLLGKWRIGYKGYPKIQQKQNWSRVIMRLPKER